MAGGTDEHRDAVINLADDDDLNSPSRLVWQHLVASEFAVEGGVLDWLDVRSVTQVAHDDRLFVPILTT